MFVVIYFKATIEGEEVQKVVGPFTSYEEAEEFLDFNEGPEEYDYPGIYKLERE